MGSWAGPLECDVLKVDPTGRYVLIRVGRQLRILDLVELQGKPVVLPTAKYARRQVAGFSPDGKFVVLVTEREGVSVFRLANAEEVISSPAFIDSGVFRRDGCNASPELPFAWLRYVNGGTGKHAGLVFAFLREAPGETELVFLDLKDGKVKTVGLGDEVEFPQSLANVDFGASPGLTVSVGRRVVKVAPRITGAPGLTTTELAEGEDFIAALQERIVLGSSGRLRLVDTKQGKELRSIDVTGSKYYDVVARSGKGLVLSAKSEDFKEERFFAVVALDAGEKMGNAMFELEPPGDAPDLSGWKISESAKYASALDTKYHSLVTYDLRLGGVSRLHPLDAYPSRVLISGDKAVGLAGGGVTATRILAVSARSGEVVLDITRRLSDRGDGVRASPDGRYLLVTSGGDGNVLANDLDSAYTGLGVLDSESDLDATLFDLTTGGEVAELGKMFVRPHFRATSLGVKEGEFSDNGLLATIGYDGAIQLWNLNR